MIEPAIGRSFGALVAEDDFSRAGDIPYCHPMIGGKKTDLQEFEKTRQVLLAIFSAAAVKRDAVNERRRQTG